MQSGKNKHSTFHRQRTADDPAFGDRSDFFDLFSDPDCGHRSHAGRRCVPFRPHHLHFVGSLQFRQFDLRDIVYDDLINIVTDELGNITMIQANTVEINSLSKDLAQATELRIEDFGGQGMGIELGSFTGIPLLVGRGPEIKLRVTPIGSVYSTFSSKFESAGINQTIHRIYLNINAAVGVVLPLYTKKFTATQNVLIAESIIVGTVPEVYLYSDTIDSLLNFVPY